jgi:acetyl-CoA carboxylase biotin carboxyl carrier protein
MDAEGFLRAGLDELLHVLQGSDVRELEVQQGDLTVRLHRTHTAEDNFAAQEELPIEVPLDEGPTVVSVLAPIVGTFYSAGKPGMSPLVSEGSWVEEDTVVGIIEALHVLTDVTAGVRGTVVRVLASDGHPVEYGQALLDVVPDG